MDRGETGDAAAREQVRRIAEALVDHYILLVVVDAQPGLPTRVSYTHRQSLGPSPKGFGKPPLVVRREIPHAAGTVPPFRVEILAPDGLEIEWAGIFVADLPLVHENRVGHAGAFVQLKAPGETPEDEPEKPNLQIVLGFPPGGMHHLAFSAALVSTVALGLGAGASYLLDASMKGAAASALVAAPALVTGSALGVTTTRVTAAAVNRLRDITLLIALLGVLGGLTVALLGEQPKYLNLRHGILVGLTALAVLTTWLGPRRAFRRRRESIRRFELS